jgi:hypothetical protein
VQMISNWSTGPKSMFRIRLNVPLNMFLNASDPNLLDPSLIFEHGEYEIRVSLKGGTALRVEKDDEPHFRSVSHCQLEIRDKHHDGAILRLTDSKNYQELIDLLMPIVNRTLAAIRNFGWVTTAREYKPEEKPEALLRAWQTKARTRGKWREVAPKPKKDALGLYGLFPLEENVERSSLSVGRWRDIEQALVENLKPNPEQEFLTNALQHLREDNLRLALVEATVCLEIVLSDALRLYLEVKKRFPKKKIEAVLSNVGLTTRVGLILDPILTYDERSRAQLDKVLKAINLRNAIVHKTGHLDPSVPVEEVHDSVYAMLNLALTLGRKREKLKGEPALEQISIAIADRFQCPRPEIETLKHHEVSVTFSFPSEVSLYLRPLGSPEAPDIKVPDRQGLQAIINEIELRLKELDPYFDPKKHLSVSFKRGVLGGTLFATFEKGTWNPLSEEHHGNPTITLPKS